MANDPQVYLSFDEVPLEKPDNEGDNSILGEPISLGQSGLASEPVTLAPQSILDIQKSLVVPHPRDLREGMKGNDVFALKRAGRKAGFKGLVMTTAFGPQLKKDLVVFQRKHGLTPDGIYGPATHKKLAPFYDAYGIYLINHTVIEAPWRAKMLSAAMIAYNERWKIHYTQGPARMWLVRNRIRNPKALYTLSAIYEDCSSFATWLYYAAYLPDPNNFGYNGLGYTGTLANHGVTISTSSAGIGALHFYGWGFPYSHVTINVGNGRAISNGSEIGPNIVSPWYRNDLRVTKEYVK